MIKLNKLTDESLFNRIEYKKTAKMDILLLIFKFLIYSQKTKWKNIYFTVKNIFIRNCEVYSVYLLRHLAFRVDKYPS